ncbi:chromate transporter, partial [Frankia sp. Cpl3]|nr:chromate transporter [Frankia sp. Cpl3]
MLPLIEQEIAAKRNLLSKQELSDIFAVAGSVPGAMAVNAATLIGYRLVGARGAFLATLGMLLPTFLIVII